MEKNINSANEHITSPFQPENRQTVELIFSLCREQYQKVPVRLSDLFTDVAALYAGRWPSHEACAVTYHNFAHALEVCLATARMLTGWNRVELDRPLDDNYFQLAMAAALFHDSGYIKNKGDQSGLGGKFTLIHVERGIVIAREYLQANNWQPEEVDSVCRIISITDYAHFPEIAPLFLDLKLKAVAQMVATADLVAQMADTDYVQRLDDLFAEFNEVYEFESPAYLAKKGTKVYRTAQDIKEGTIAFYEQFVLPTLGKLGRMDRYLEAFFSGHRNPYKENIANNLSSEILEVRSQFRRLTDIPNHQATTAMGSPPQSPAPESFQDILNHRLLPWFKDRTGNGEKTETIISDNRRKEEKISQGTLLDQVIPDSLCDSLSQTELKFLLKISIFLQKTTKNIKTLETVLEMANEVLNCEASSILLADLAEKKLFIAMPTGAKKDLVRGIRSHLDKGLSGWVYTNGLEAIVNDVSADVRFDRSIDLKIDFYTRSILAVPLHLHGNCIGVLEALNKREGDFTRQDANILSIIANMFARFMSQILDTTPGQ